MRGLWGILVIVGAELLPVAGAAQSGPDPRQSEMNRRIPVTIAVPETELGPAAPVVLRKAHGAAPDILVLPKLMATSSELVLAAYGVNAIRDATGDTAHVDGMYRVRVPGLDQSKVPAGEERVARLTLDRVLRRPPHMVPGVGLARTAEIYLPSRQMRQDAARRARADR